MLVITRGYPLQTLMGKSLGAATLPPARAGVWSIDPEAVDAPPRDGSSYIPIICRTCIYIYMPYINIYIYIPIKYPHVGWNRHVCCLNTWTPPHIQAMWGKPLQATPVLVGVPANHWAIVRCEPSPHRSHPAHHFAVHGFKWLKWHGSRSFSY